MDKRAREVVLWEVESMLDDELPDLKTVSHAVRTAIQRELTDSLNPLFDLNKLAEIIMAKVLDLLDYDAALELLKEAHGDPTIGSTTQGDIRTFLKDHGIKVGDREE